MTQEEMMANGTEYYKKANALFEDEQYEESIPWLLKAVDLGNLDAMCTIGYCYNLGKGVKKDVYKAIEYYSKAASYGYRTACANLAYIYSCGDTIRPNKALATYWSRQDALAGSSFGKYEIEEYGEKVDD